jgi:AraC-like DNA-binding protein
VHRVVVAVARRDPSPYDRNVPALVRNSCFRGITPGIETLHHSFSLPRHRHLHAYATVVVAGRFEESGYVGRICATAGDVLIHPVLDCHENRKVVAGLRLIRIEWPDANGITAGLYHLNDVDEIARAAEKDVLEARARLEHTLAISRFPSPGRRSDWPDLLLLDLTRDTTTEIVTWAERRGLARETVSRGFAAAYGIPPSVMRAELRTRSAWLRITRGSDPLPDIAAETGFADQAHMTRWIDRMTGAPPSVWRRGASAGR